CGHCNKPDVKHESVITPEVVSSFERETPAWFADEIARKKTALISAENHIRFLELEIAQQESTNLDTLKKRKAEASAANDLRHEISRLEIQKANSETATVKDERTQAEITRDKIKALKGEK